MTKKNVLTKIVVSLTYPIELYEWDTAVSFEWDKTKLANGTSHISRTNAPQWDIPLRKNGQTPKERTDSERAKNTVENVFETQSPPYRLHIDYPTFPYKKRSKSTD